MEANQLPFGSVARSQNVVLLPSQSRAASPSLSWYMDGYKTVRAPPMVWSKSTRPAHCQTSGRSDSSGEDDTRSTCLHGVARN